MVTPTPTLLVVGNPLLDIVTKVTPDFLEKYGLLRGTATLQGSQQQNLFNELLEGQFGDVTFLPGGSGLNTARTFHAFAKQPQSAAYIGAIGKDREGEILRNITSEEGLHMILQEVPVHRTGRCAVLVSDKERTLCTALGAALHLKMETMDLSVLDTAKFCYSTGYVLSSSSKDLQMLAKRCVDQKKLFALNLSAEFCIRQNINTLLKLLPDVNILFGNEDEFDVLAKAVGISKREYLDEDSYAYYSRVGVTLLKRYMKRKKPSVVSGVQAALPSPGNHLKVVVITMGEKPVIIVQARADGTIDYYQAPVKEIPFDEIVDTNGAGDAFVGGFLYALSEGHSLLACSKLGSCAAANVLRHEGFAVNVKDCMI